MAENGHSSNKHQGQEYMVLYGQVLYMHTHGITVFHQILYQLQKLHSIKQGMAVWPIAS
jgi:hypothetical protein